MERACTISADSEADEGDQRSAGDEVWGSTRCNTKYRCDEKSQVES
jgi:hypothetical protein